MQTYLYFKSEIKSKIVNMRVSLPSVLFDTHTVTHPK